MSALQLSPAGIVPLQVVLSTLKSAASGPVIDALVIVTSPAVSFVIVAVWVSDAPSFMSRENVRVSGLPVTAASADAGKAPKNSTSRHNRPHRATPLVTARPFPSIGMRAQRESTRPHRH